MAGRHTKPAANQYRLDYESPRAERFALWMGALEAAGLQRCKPLALVVFNAIEASPTHEPCGYRLADYQTLLGVKSENTVRKRRDELAAAGLVAIQWRTYVKGGTKTCLVSIDWPAVRALARRQPRPDRPSNFAPRPSNFAPRPSNFEGPIKEDHSLRHSLETTTTTTLALPHALPCEATTVLRSEEEESSLRKLLRDSFEKIPNTPRYLERALRQALAAGCSVRQLWERCAWWHKHRSRWASEHQAGVFHDGIAEALPDMPAHQGWPYQR